MLKQYYGYGGGDPRGKPPPPEDEKHGHGLVMGLVPVLLDAGCWYMIDSENLIPAGSGIVLDEWSMVSTLALASGGVSAADLLFSLIGMHGKFLGTIFGLGKLGASGFGLY